MSHYQWLERNLPEFFVNLKLDPKYCSSIISSSGDKCYSAEGMFERNGIHFFHGAAIYLLTSIHPYSEEVRQTENGWVDPFQWIVDNKERFLPYLPKV